MEEEKEQALIMCHSNQTPSWSESCLLLYISICSKTLTSLSAQFKNNPRI